MTGFNFRKLINCGYDLFTDAFVRRMHLKPLETGVISENLLSVKTGTVNFYLYRENNIIMCFDSGFGRDKIKQQLDKLNIDPSEVTHVFLTHSDFDHAGGLELFKNAEIYLSREEEQMILRKKGRMLGIFYNSGIKRRYHLLDDGDTVKISSVNVKAIATPGHTPGSMSYLINDSYLFVGDTFRLADDKVYPLRSCINMDTEKQKESIKKLADLNAKYAFTGHSGYTEDFQASIHEWKGLDNKF